MPSRLSQIERNYLDKLIEDYYNGVITNEETIKELPTFRRVSSKNFM